MASVISADPPFRFKVIPVFARHRDEGALLPYLYSQHAFQTLFALIAIFALKPFVRANYGLRWPPGKTYVSQALLWGTFFGVLMTVVGYAPQLIAHTSPTVEFPLTLANVGRWLFFEGVYVGPTEETPFRALLVSYLAATMPGKLHIV